MSSRLSRQHHNILGAGGILSEVSAVLIQNGVGRIGAFQIKNVPTDAGDDIKMDVSYAQGVTKYVIATSEAGGPAVTADRPGKISKILFCWCLRAASLPLVGTFGNFHLKSATVCWTPGRASNGCK